MTQGLSKMKLMYPLHVGKMDDLYKAEQAVLKAARMWNDTKGTKVCWCKSDDKKRCPMHLLSKAIDRLEKLRGK